MNHEEEYNVQGYDHAFSNEPLFQDHQYEEDAHSANHGHPHAAQPGYQAEGYEEEAYEADENFPEPPPDGKEKKGLSKGMTAAVAGIGAVAIALGCAYIYDADMVTNAPGQLIAMVTGGDAGSEPAPEPAVAKPHHKKAAGAAGDPADTPVAAHPHRKPPHPVAAKPDAAAAANGDPKAVVAAAKPAADPAPDAAKPGAVEFKPANKPVKPAPAAKKAAAVAAIAAVPPKPAAMAKPKPAAKPKLPVVAAKPVAAAAMAGVGGGAKTSVGFAAGSYWVAASEIEHLWSYTSGLKANSGQFTVESWVSGSENDGLNLSRKRANRVAELLTKNTPAHAYKVTVKIHGAPAAKTAARKVAVSFSSKL
jgi:outer membrane protein OmpA-like peptidoglycan-associated protein